MEDNRKIASMTVAELNDALYNMQWLDNAIAKATENAVERVDIIIDKKLELYGLDNPKESRTRIIFIDELIKSGDSFKKGFFEKAGGMVLIAFVGGMFATLIDKFK